MFIKAIIVGDLRPHSSGRKRSKAAASEHSSSTLPDTPQVHHSSVGATVAVTLPIGNISLEAKQLPSFVWVCKGSPRPSLLIFSHYTTRMILLHHPLTDDLFHDLIGRLLPWFLISLY